MAEATIQAASRFPNGTTVSVYNALGASGFPQGGPAGLGGAVTTGEVSENQVTFTGLEEDVPYFAAAEVNGEWRAVSFKITSRGTYAGVVTRNLAGGLLETHRGESVSIATDAEIEGKADLEGGKLKSSQLPSSVVLDSQLEANGKGYVNHGEEAATARPEGFASIEWQGSVEPENAENDDTWIET